MTHLFPECKFGGRVIKDVFRLSPFLKLTPPADNLRRQCGFTSTKKVPALNRLRRYFLYRYPEFALEPRDQRWVQDLQKQKVWGQKARWRQELA